MVNSGLSRFTRAPVRSTTAAPTWRFTSMEVNGEDLSARLVVTRNVWNDRLWTDSQIALVMTSSSLDTWTAGAKLARPKTASSRVLIVDHWVGSSSEIRMRPARLYTWQGLLPRRAWRRLRTSRSSTM